jgi:hypothetical protein
MRRSKYTPATPAQKASFQEMLRSQKPPIIKGTDSKNFQGLNPFPNMPEFMRQHYLKEARKAGVEPNGKIYKMGLVRPEYAGKFDPEALVDSTSQVKGTLERRGWGCEGMVEVAPTPLDTPPEQVDVADDLVEEHTLNDIAAEGIEKMKVSEFKDRKAKKKQQLRGTDG